jgi:hypothetical protein
MWMWNYPVWLELEGKVARGQVFKGPDKDGLEAR